MLPVNVCFLPKSSRDGSLPVELRSQLTAGLLAVLLSLTVVLALVHGSVSISLTELWAALRHQGLPIHETILWDLRLPRIAAALTVGAALGMSGALLQGMLRNGLADPFILGISAGAGLVAIAFLTLQVLVPWVPLAAWAGALLTTALVYGLGRGANGLVVERLILGGVAVSSLLGAVQTTLLLLADDGRIQMALNWLIGSLNGRGWSDLRLATPYVVLALIGGCLLSRRLNLLSLGDELAVSLGLSLTRSRLLIGGVATLLAAGAVSIAGLIGFVGLVVPHGVRLLVGADYRWIIPLSALGGAWVLTLADLVARLGAVELPVGAVMALLGSPLFIWLLYRRTTLLSSP
ncbi:iron chelate uptake ABC transporter family permease subunit [Synechococcales cyanobacterium C]|uniref:Iron chelate uptake ABC transporter family permease subunit n=1 Tax=Petrachloros mirabilis ULC683 TaxID=2781853 RepID=A0A8K2A999_9CYAN|nr:iron ABC transporter permease [Petrachloros mirabilis]NCJ07820.1 iron chelate uptake ABC transporter family permease subunit [Petrachloros mirabilis ULC683]